MYTPHLPRVSRIVETLFPFNGERFEKWLREKGIGLEEYMEEASVGGTYVHNAIEKSCKGETYEKDERWEPFVKMAMAWLEKGGWSVVHNEKYIRTPLYQGTIDCIARNAKGELYVLDWKTYGLAKYKWDVVGTYRKPYDKLKKARLQLSLYAEAEGIANIGVVELAKDAARFHILKKHEDTEELVAKAIQLMNDDGSDVPGVHNLSPAEREQMVEA